MSKMSRDKGARGEREAAKYLTKLGFDCQRNARNGISTDDLHCPGLPNVHIEVKFGYQSMDIHTASLRNALEQADKDADLKQNICVLWRPLRKPWRLTWILADGIALTTTGNWQIKTQLLTLNGKG